MLQKLGVQLQRAQPASSSSSRFCAAHERAWPRTVRHHGLLWRRAQSAAGWRTRAAQSPAEVGKLISKTEVPTLIPRDDMSQQLLRWAVIEAQEGGLRNFGMPMKVTPIYNDEVLWGFTVTVVKEGVDLTDIRVAFDDELVDKHEYIGWGPDGFPQPEGKTTSMKGKHLEIWKMDTKPVTEDLRAVIRNFCTGLVAALNKLYAFGSVFSDDG